MPSPLTSPAATTGTPARSPAAAPSIRTLGAVDRSTLAAAGDATASRPTDTTPLEIHLHAALRIAANPTPGHGPGRPTRFGPVTFGFVGRRSEVNAEHLSPWLCDPERLPRRCRIATARAERTDLKRVSAGLQMLVL